jgi:hypothetical protein
MHVHAHIEGLRVYARIPSFACFCMCLLVSRAELVSAFVGSYQGKSVCRLYQEMSAYLH